MATVTIYRTDGSSETKTVPDDQTEQYDRLPFTDPSVECTEIRF